MASVLKVDKLQGVSTTADVHIPGHVVQFQHNLITLNSGSISSSTMVDLPNVYVDITPKNASNLIVFHTNFHAAVTGTNSYARFRVVDANNSDTQYDLCANLTASHKYEYFPFGSVPGLMPFA